MNTTPDPPHYTLRRTDHHTPNPAPGPLVHPRPGADLTPHQLALLAALIQQTGTTPDVPTTAPAAPAPTETRMSGRAKDTALMVAAGGTGIGAAGAGIGYGSGLIATASGGLMTAAIALAIATGSITAAVALIRTTCKTSTAGEARESEQRATTHITQNISATGLFGKANGTINNR
ncbi:hypothetical protein [Streptomyces profundus]|uniref:hypothetical protein n=1 Tax=Streptomyces profundus TaxID=2867410 RepID=UPI001D15FE3F|nr:hypothetical protein [Streptomyces sp. MA3_2.13]UED85295.1 hypothetical protein K4G22_14735 [Streptomyces sp. MA3_2.13]